MKYNANQEALVEQRKGTPMEEDEGTIVEEEGGTIVEEEKEPRTPSQLTLDEGKNKDSMDKKCCGSNNHVTVKSRHQKECGSPSYVHYQRHTSK